MSLAIHALRVTPHHMEIRLCYSGVPLLLIFLAKAVDNNFFKLPIVDYVTAVNSAPNATEIYNNYCMVVPLILKYNGGTIYYNAIIILHKWKFDFNYYNIMIHIIL